MKIKYQVIVLAQLLMLSQSCDSSRYNPIDEGGKNFDPPTITINEGASSVSNYDTIHFDTATVVLIGNRELSRFKVKIDNHDWTTDWQSAGPFKISSLEDNWHNLTIATMYDGGEKQYYDTIRFFVQVKGYKPEFSNANDSIILSDTGISLFISTTAAGATPFYYTWLKNESPMSGHTLNTLAFDTFTISDTSSYRCVASNQYGVDTSRIFVLKYRPPTGSIKGSIVDVSNNNKLSDVRVTLQPGNRIFSTDTKGIFEFLNLSGKTYSINISKGGFYDSSISGIKVKDSIVVLPVVLLSKIILSNVVYLGNGNDSGSVPIDTTKYKPGMVVKVSENSKKLKKSGYTFKGWNSTKDGKGTVYQPLDTFLMGKVNDTLYAIWQINQHTISFNGNSNTLGNPPATINSDYNVKVTIPDKGTLERPGYSFSGWNINSQNTGVLYAVKDTFKMPDSNVVLFAKWEKLSTYKVTYNENNKTGGTVPVDTSNYYAGQKITVIGNPGNLEKTGFSFAGWNENDSGTGKNYTAGSTFSMPGAPVTIYARWTTKPTYIIIYNGNTNTGGKAPDSVNFDSGATITIGDSGTLFKTGYSFSAWNTLQNGNGTSYKSGDKRNMDTVSITLYAQWVESKYTVTYHGNGNTRGTVPPLSNYLYGTKATVANVGDLGKIGHTFYRWNTDSMGMGVDYNAGDQITINGKNIELYARWTKNKYSVLYIGNGNDGGNAPAVLDFEYNSSVTVAEKGSMTKTGHSFDGWNRSKTGNGTKVIPGSSYIIDASNDTLYAQWKVNHYTVAFNTMGGNIINPIQVNYGDTVPLPTKPNKTSYVFAEWYKDPGCLNKWISFKDTIKGEDTLFAKWVIKDVDGNIYTEVKIGDQVWMVENLKTTKYNDGTPILLAESEGIWATISMAGYCWYNNDSVSYKQKFGALYNWYVVNPLNLKKIAPVGWHVPSNDEWDTLQNYLIANGYNWDGTTTENKISKALSAKTSWVESSDEGATGCNLSTNNRSGFTALSGGYRTSSGQFFNLGETGIWWPAAEYDTSLSWYFSIYYVDPFVVHYYNGKKSGYSVRCVKDR